MNISKLQQEIDAIVEKNLRPTPAMLKELADKHKGYNELQINEMLAASYERKKQAKVN